MFGLLVFGTIAVFIFALGRAGGERSFWRPAVFVIGGLFLLGSWPPGYLDTRLACRDDGGLRIKRQVHADGFFLMQPSADSSMSSWDYDPVVTGQVRYMDFNKSIWDAAYRRNETV